MSKVRLNIQIDDGTKSFIEQQSKKLGISQNGLINLAIFQYKQDYETDLVIADVKNRLAKIEGLNEENALSKNNNK